jgi:hypothetical protein
MQRMRQTVGKGSEKLAVKASISSAQTYYYLRVIRVGNAKDKSDLAVPSYVCSRWYRCVVRLLRVQSSRVQSLYKSVSARSTS